MAEAPVGRSIAYHPELIVQTWSRVPLNEVTAFKLLFLTRSGVILPVHLLRTPSPTMGQCQVKLLGEGRIVLPETLKILEDVHHCDAADGPLLTTLQTIIGNLQSLLGRIEDCKHCERMFIDDGRGCCHSCFVLQVSQIQSVGPCIVCKTTTHPIQFICKTCVDSQICSQCVPNLRSPTCQICKQKPNLDRNWSEQEIMSFESCSDDDE